MDIRLRQSGFLRQTLVSNQSVRPEIHHGYFELVACCFQVTRQLHSRGFRPSDSQVATIETHRGDFMQFPQVE